jgi:hypothetical protein
MNKLIKKLTAVVLCVTTFGAQAAETFNACAPAQIRVAFSNGILTPVFLGRDTARTVQKRAAELNNRVRVDEGNVVFFYHESNGIGDFAETFLQKEKEPAFADISFAAKATTFLRVITGVADGSALATALLVIAQKAVPAALMADAQSRVDLAVANDVKLAKNVLDQGDSLMVVAHSQGNLYSNEVLRQLYATMPASQVDNRVAMISAANPARGVVGKGGMAYDYNYVTSTTDLVIDGVRLAALALGQLQPSLPNVTGVNLGMSVTDVLVQHSFMGVYFNEALDTGKALVQFLTTNLNNLANGAPAPDPTSSIAYTFKTTLTYGVSLAELFEGAGAIDVPQVGPYAGSYRSRVVSLSDKSLSFETDVMCSLTSALPVGQASPISVGLAFPAEAGTPVASDVQVLTSDKAVTWKYPVSVLKFTPETIQGESMLTLSALTAMVQNKGEGKGIVVSNPNPSNN